MTNSSKNMLTKLRSKSYNLKSLTDFIESVRYLGTETEIRQLVDAILKNPIANKLSFNYLPKNYDKLRIGKVLALSSLEKDFILIDQLIRRNKETLKSYLSLRYHLENEISLSNYEKSAEILLNIENSICCSVWSMEANIFLAQNFGTLNERAIIHSHYLQSNSTFSQIFAFFIINRNEPSISLSKFTEFFEKYLHDNKFSEFYIAYFRYFTLNVYPQSERDLQFLLTNTLSTSIIDLYNLYADLVIFQTQNLTIFSIDKDIISRSLSFMQELGDDRAITVIDNEINPDFIPSFYPNPEMDYIKYTISNLVPHTNRNFLIDLIYSSLLIEKGNQGSKSEYVSFQKIASNTKFLNFSKFISLSLSRVLNKNENILKGNYILSAIYVPRHISQFEEFKYDVDREKIINKVTTFRHIDQLILQGRYGDFIDQTFPDICNEMEFAISKMEALIKLKLYAEGVRYLAEVVAHNAEALYFMPVYRLLSNKKLRHFREIRDDIALPIAYHALYRNTTEVEDLDQLRWSVDDLLADNKISSAADLVNIFSPDQKEILIYFLDKVCVHDILEACRGNKNQNKVYEERMKICNVLIKIDSTNSDRYLEEIRNIATKSITEEGIKLLDTNRIYVNTRGITEWADTEIREVFNRYTSLSGFALTKRLVEALTNMTNSSKEAGITEESILDLGIFEIEGDRLLNRMIRNISDKYYYSPQYGLNSFLSTRVRHGKITTALRGCLEGFNLITTREDKELPYQNNNYWKEKLCDLSEDKMADLQKILQRFSEDFDILVEEELKTKLYIKGSESPNGFFKEDLSVRDINIIRRSLTGDISFEKFISSVISTLNEGLEQQLEEFRSYLSLKFKQSVGHLFDYLMENVDRLNDRAATLELRNTIAEANGIMLTKLRTVENWFYLDSLSRSTKKYNFDQMIEISFLYATGTIQGFSAKIRKSIIGESKFEYSHLKLISDILYILVDNINKWSGFTEPDIELIAVIQDDDLTIELKNNTADYRRSHYLTNRINNIGENIRRGDYALHTPKEGGSGMYKIKTLISYIDGHEFYFNFDEEGIFSAKIKLPISNMRIK